jgi:hypothetical protein
MAHTFDGGPVAAPSSHLPRARRARLAEFSLLRTLWAAAVLCGAALVVGCSSSTNAPTDVSSDGGPIPPNSSSCSGWAQTGDCVATGPLQPQNDQPCDVDLDRDGPATANAASARLG